MKFRKKPVVIEACRVRDALYAASNNWDALPVWLRDAYERPGKHSLAIVFALDYISIGTLEGVMTANIDDWIIQGVQGEIYPCKPDIFEATYEFVETFVG